MAVARSQVWTLSSLLHMISVAEPGSVAQGSSTMRSSVASSAQAAVTSSPTVSQAVTQASSATPSTTSGTENGLSPRPTLRTRWATASRWPASARTSNSVQGVGSSN